MKTIVQKVLFNKEQIFSTHIGNLIDEEVLDKKDNADPSPTLPNSRILIGPNALVKSENIELCSVKLDPRQVIQYHTHKGDEAIFVIFGRRLFKIKEGGQELKIELVPEMACIAPAGVEHELTANSEL